MKEITLALHEDIYQKLEHYAIARGLTTEEAVRFLIRDILAGGMFNQGISGISIPVPLTPPPALKDPWDMLYNMLAAMGIIRCEDCSKKLTAEEIKVNNTKCFTCKPDVRDMEF